MRRSSSRVASPFSKPPVAPAQPAFGFNAGFGVANPPSSRAIPGYRRGVRIGVRLQSDLQPGRECECARQSGRQRAARSLRWDARSRAVNRAILTGCAPCDDPSLHGAFFVALPPRKCVILHPSGRCTVFPYNDSQPLVRPDCPSANQPPTRFEIPAFPTPTALARQRNGGIPLDKAIIPVATERRTSSRPRFPDRAFHTSVMPPTTRKRVELLPGGRKLQARQTPAVSILAKS